jgi:bifunctional DNase/RNase
MALSKVDFYDLRYDHRHNSPVLFLKDSEREKFLPVWIGELEASSIELAVREKTLARPVTHDLMCNMMHKLGSRLVKVVIDRLVNRTYFASLVIESDGQLIEVDCRPSDAIALALREQASMFVDEELMYRIKFVELSEGEEDDGDDDEGITEALEQVDAQTFQQFLKGISPSDFKDG